MDIPSLQANFDPKNGGMVEFGSDDKLYVTFSSKAVVDVIKSREAARPIHQQITYVRIQQPAERDYVERPATDLDIRRFRRQYQHFLDGKAEQPEGTLLSVLFFSNPEIVENLKYLKVFTIEQLANLNDTQIQQIGMGGREFHQRAKDFLSKSEKGKGFHELEKRLEQLELSNQVKDEKIKALEAALAESGEEPVYTRDFTTDQPVAKRRGRKPKIQGA